MMRIVSLTIAAWVIASQVSALSCMRSDVAESYDRAASSDNEYVVLWGAFDFDMPQQTSTDPNFPDVLRTIARFNGQYLGASGFTPAPPLVVSMVFNCTGPWCGSLQPGADDILAYVEQTDGGYILTVEACGGTAFVAPNDVDIARVEACMRGPECR